ncbi:pyruvate kinase [Spiroplasma culicicola]|uniref:Pyruvate kinase n=1 Tax=Spiroplasma culicicola AES-1 TaxID=1276246 RepID=W6A6I1_9MOLU|nr:pyruvate kinase [Spiroplasma culicicola]AHI52576.1 pyruvate kinase [Spiroplasma culicicola AES-1]
MIEKNLEFYEPSVLAKKVKRTKIVTTIGPSTNTKNDIRKLFESGMNVVRLNFSHGSQDEHVAKITSTKELRDELEKPISILLDTKGPEIRVGKMIDGAQEVKAGSDIRIYTRESDYKTKECKATEMTVSYDMSVDLKAGDTILVDDGKLTLNVLNVEPGLINCRAFNSHVLKTNKRINLPGVDFSLPFLSDKDIEDIRFGAKQDIDYIAASFVNTAQNVNDIRAILKEENAQNIQIISKIESKIGIFNLDEIIEASDGIMVARGDLGLEIPFYEVPYWEKQMIRKCRKAGKICIVATQMLESMTDNPQPTRAEVTDVYYATELGTDATMLSGESAAGIYPFITTETMATINKRAELSFYGKIYYDRALENARQSSSGKRAEIADELANITRNGKYEYAIVLSRTGELLKTISKFRPNVTILGVCDDPKLWNAFGAWHSIFMNKVDSIDEVAENPVLLGEIARSWGAKKGEEILIVKSEDIKIHTL